MNIRNKNISNIISFCNLSKTKIKKKSNFLNLPFKLIKFLIMFNILVSKIYFFYLKTQQQQQKKRKDIT